MIKVINRGKLKEIIENIKLEFVNSVSQEDIDNRVEYKATFYMYMKTVVVFTDALGVEHKVINDFTEGEGYSLDLDFDLSTDLGEYFIHQLKIDTYKGSRDLVGDYTDEVRLDTDTTVNYEKCDFMYRPFGELRCTDMIIEVTEINATLSEKYSKDKFGKSIEIMTSEDYKI